MEDPSDWMQSRGRTLRGEGVLKENLRISLDCEIASTASHCTSVGVECVEPQRLVSGWCAAGENGSWCH